MIDHLIDTDLSYEINVLWKTSQLKEFISNIINTCRKFELELAYNLFRIESPAWIKRAHVIYQRIYNDNENFTDLWCLKFNN